MQARFALLLVVISLALGGCATPPQQPVLLSQSSFSSPDTRIGVAMTKLPQVDTYLPGAGCLLCLAAASIANSSLTEYAHTLPYEDLPQLKDRMGELIGRKGVTVVLIKDPLDVQQLSSFSGSGPNVARKDFSHLKSTYQIDKLVVIEIDYLGFWRTYSSYFPTSDPKAVMKGSGYMVNLSNNTYEWYAPIEIMRSASGNWDESPKFPGLTNAYYQVLEEGKDQFTQPFAAPTASSGPAPSAL